MNLKEEAAKNAICLIKENMIVGLGAGANIAHLVNLLAPKIKAGLGIRLVTASFSTQQLLLQHALQPLSVTTLVQIDIYFDGCDQLDKNLNALKSGGGIHTMEKLLASMAKQFIILGDESKLVERFDNRYPIVLEVLPQAIGYIPHQLEKLFPGSKISYRISEKKDGYVLSENGNCLLDFWPSVWPALARLHNTLKGITGVVEISLFYQLASKAIIAGIEGVSILEK